MLDIISMATFIITMFSIVIFMLLIIIGGNLEKSDTERYLEDKEQMDYLKTYQEEKAKKRKNNIWRCLWEKIHILGNK